jgi:hypothetical protein
VAEKTAAEILEVVPRVFADPRGVTKRRERTYIPTFSRRTSLNFEF